MSGAQIGEMLTDQVLVYEDATQKFFASGRTLFDASEPSWGSWVVRGDQYCSLWPPSDTWDCYDMTRAGQSVQFVDSYGNVSQGRRGWPNSIAVARADSGIFFGVPLYLPVTGRTRY